MKTIFKSNLSKENQVRIMSTAAFLKEYRLQCGLTQEMVSEYAELNRSSIIRLEAGFPVSFITICKYASGISLPLSQLFLEIN